MRSPPLNALLAALVMTVTTSRALAEPNGRPVRPAQTRDLSTRLHDLMDPAIKTRDAAVRPGAVTYRVPRFHDAGILNSGLFQTADGTLVKFSRDFASVNPTGARRRAEEALKLQLRGAILGEGLGGPKLRRAGFVTEGSAVYYFMEMEKLLPESARTFSLKGTMFTPPLVLRTFDWDRLLGELAKLMVSALERDVHLKDIDFIFSANELRWIDTTEWVQTPNFKTSIDQLFRIDDWRVRKDPFFSILDWADRIKPGNAALLTAKIGRLILASTVWSPAERAARMDVFRQYLERPTRLDRFGRLKTGLARAVHCADRLAERFIVE